ncbi:hypothetical protein [Lacticaseibacillus jixiensis]|uniref:hypothetical protein n=1 Tax=Lacticaseibacillus jixiensis TaxID=3231926 RepID=UPI0036F1D96B
MILHDGRLQRYATGMCVMILVLSVAFGYYQLGSAAWPQTTISRQASFIANVGIGTMTSFYTGIIPEILAPFIVIQACGMLTAPITPPYLSRTARKAYYWKTQLLAVQRTWWFSLRMVTLIGAVTLFAYPGLVTSLNVTIFGLWLLACLVVEFLFLILAIELWQILMYALQSRGKANVACMLVLVLINIGALLPKIGHAIERIQPSIQLNLAANTAVRYYNFTVKSAVVAQLLEAIVAYFLCAAVLFGISFYISQKKDYL